MSIGRYVLRYANKGDAYEIENSWDGFEWLEASDCDANFIAYQRTDKNGNKMLALINFSGKDHIGYRLGVEKGKYQMILNSDSIRFGGSGRITKRVFTAERKYSHNKEYSIAFDIPKLTCLYFIKTI